MQLNLYLISHPIIQKLASDVSYDHKYTSPNINNYKYKNLGLLMIYEVVRKYIKTEKIHIKAIDCIEEFCILSQEVSCLILADIKKSYSIISDITWIFPEIHIQPIYFSINENILNQSDIKNKIKSINGKKIILLMQSHLDDYSSIEILDYLTKYEKINIESIRIVCITCDNQIIGKIGKKYPKLTMYASKVTDN
uniref:Uracil phosphoribosyltransferase n=1 Tax=Rhodymenia pseudopalmata TaxID=31502 RepID=A0A1C9C7R0_RHOPU|nr:uracil phosphoribosyltransferase [Rhodymenia pseudopalmata]AOM64417.1 uracil phosphoribosyltransferase [Rhodymenia pseudopalmata]